MPAIHMPTEELSGERIIMAHSTRNEKELGIVAKVQHVTFEREKKEEAISSK